MGFICTSFLHGKFNEGEELIYSYDQKCLLSWILIHTVDKNEVFSVIQGDDSFITVMWMFFW